MSFGSEPSSQFDALSLGANSLWDNGIVVVSAVGNDGPRVGSVKSPATSRKIISVGAIDTTISPPRVASFSSRGPIFDVVKPDVVAPGVDITSLDNSPQLFTTMSGTSVSTPTVAGLCALLIECQPTLSPNDIKAILIGNANSIGAEANQQGSGVVDAEKCWLSIKNDKDSLD
jgi:serine protease AprX